MVKQRPQKLLIIDEINYTRLVLTQALSSDGYKVLSAQNSGEAMQYIVAELPDVILLSLRSSDAGGAAAMRLFKDYFRLRLDVAHGAEPAIILLSDFRDTKQMREVQSLGVSQSLSKPINIQELLNSVRSAITNKDSVPIDKQMKIMLFDGETRSQQFLESVLAHEMYDIEAADSEAELLARIKNRSYDLIIIDLTSLENEITDMLKTIMEINKEVPIATIATSADQVSQGELEQLGVQVHFVKPLDIAIFRTEIDALLQKEEEAKEEEVEQSDEESQDKEETT